MTSENRSKNAAEELARAEECLREAETLRQSGLPYGAASRAYYAVFTLEQGRDAVAQAQAFLEEVRRLVTAGCG